MNCGIARRDFAMFGRVYCLWMRGGSYILRAIKRFRILGIGYVQSRADKFDSLLQVERCWKEASIGVG